MTLNDKALALLNEGRVLEAIPILRDLSWREPSYKAYINLASALRYAGDFDSAIQYLTRALRLDVQLPHAWMSLANLSTDIGDWDHALKYYEGALFRVSQQGALDSTNQGQRQVALGFAQALLRFHEYKIAWPLWEFGRFGYSYSELPGTQRWLGEPCDTLLVICEGGYGDGMLFGRWLPFAKTRAKHVKLVIWDRMVSFRDWRVLGVDEVIPKSAEIDPAGIQYTTSWMSLPGIAGMRSVSDIPEDDGLFYPLGNFLLESAEEIPRVGFCWRAEENSTIRRIRSLSCPEAEALATRLAVHGEVISLCPLGKQLLRPDAEPWPGNVLQDEALLDGWDRTAQTIRSCKFVVTVDTAVAHLAGLCGVPTLLLLPVASDWKWGMASNQPEDPWYGPHVRYYRNTSPLGWDAENIALVAGDLVGACTTHP